MALRGASLTGADEIVQTEHITFLATNYASLSSTETRTWPTHGKTETKSNCDYKLVIRDRKKILCGNAG